MKTKLMFIACALSVVALAGCGQQSDPYKYTYNTYLPTKPKTWSCHNWETVDEMYILKFTEMGFYDLQLNSSKDGYEIIPEMAASDPVDVSKTAYTPEVKELYGYEADELDNGYIWDVELNVNAKWEDGTPITATDYIESMKRQLDPKLSNFRADSYYASSLVIANAEKYYKNEIVTFNNVGLKAIGDYKLRFYLANPVIKTDLQFSLTSNWLVKTDLYDSLTISTGGMKATGYATPDKGASGYMSYGPYKLTSYEAGKSFKLVKNDQWYGYSDGKHQDQFVIESIYTRIIEDHNTAKQEFLAGRLDELTLNKTDMKDYGNSSRLLSSYESHTQKISFNSDFTTLNQRQKEKGKNRTVLSNLDFRKGLSLSLDRNDFAASATTGAKGFTGLLNDLYLTDVEGSEMYRTTERGKWVYEEVYSDLGGTPDNRKPLETSATGYNFQMAAYYVAEGMKQEILNEEDGHLKANDKISLEFRVYDNESETTKDYINFITSSFSSVINAAVLLLKEDGTLASNENIYFELNTVKDENYPETASKGGHDLIFSTWGGAEVNPIGLMQVYCDATFGSCLEYGFMGKQDETDLWIDLDHDNEVDEGETKTYHDWWMELINTTETDERDTPEWEATHDKILTILSSLEAGVLKRFEAVPLIARATATLNSYKIENGTTSYISLIGYGGVRHLKFNYNNNEWNDFLNQNGSSLADLYKN